MELYFAQCGENIKIGIARDVRARMSNLRVASASPINLIASVKGDQHVERKLHELLAMHRVNGEWFKDCEEVRAAIQHVIHSSDVPPLPSPQSRNSTKFAAVAKTLWPNKTAAHLAAIAGTSERTATRWLSGKFEPPNCIVLAVIAETFGKST